MTDRLDMSGVWYGRWTPTSRGVRPNNFIALIQETQAHLSGTISEPDLYGNDPVVRATLDGARTGTHVAFIKQYDGSGRLNHAVRYEGRVNGAGTEVTGRWLLSGYSGNFVMERENMVGEALDEEIEADLPIPVA